MVHDLNYDLNECLKVLPKSVHKLVKRTIIWINESYIFGPINKPNNVDFATTHHGKDWLLW